MMKLIIKPFLFVFLLLITHSSFAGGGMWLPLLLKALNESEMQDMGMKMTADDIYNVNKSSLKDAIVHFNGGCTSEIISGHGLLLTNHHCGYSQIQSHSTLEKNYLKDGFWAKNLDSELKNDNLSATLIVRMEDVTDRILKGVNDQMSTQVRQSVIDQNLELVKSETKMEEYQEVKIRPFYKGNTYYLFVTVTYLDVRLVGTPPESIGKFGSDTDNWVWPRHTGDFSLFRIYADKNNLPAAYSPDNIPYKPKHFLPISLDGVAEGDFTLVFGFPGRTNQYLPSPAVQQIIDVRNPAKIDIRDHALKIIDAKMRADEGVRLQYASKFARVANYWKKWIGESTGLKSTNALAKKAKFEAEFTNRINSNPTWKKQYGDILPQFRSLYSKIEPLTLSKDYYDEVVSRNVEMMRVASYMNRLKNIYTSSGEEGFNNFKGRLLGYFNGFYKDYRSEIDQEVFASLFELYAKNVPIDAATNPLKNYMAKHHLKDYKALSTFVYSKTSLTNLENVKSLLEKKPEDFISAVEKDGAFQFYMALTDAYNEHVSKQYNEINTQITDLQRRYMKGILEVFSEKPLYPDANSTLRVSYGQVRGYQPRDAVSYNPVTYLSGVMEKYKPGDYEFDVPEKLQTLFEQKDYGNYAADNGKMPVCFLGSNHTTGGNSGSPAIDAHGNLIGLNFDRVWEGTMSDINYDPSICRNIMVDIRYVLFLIDKYGGASHLIQEMKLVHPKK